MPDDRTVVMRLTDPVATWLVTLGDFARDGSQATVKLQVNRLVSWIWIGGLVLTLGAILAIAPERRRVA